MKSKVLNTQNLKNKATLTGVVILIIIALFYGLFINIKKECFATSAQRVGEEITFNIQNNTGQDIVIKTLSKKTFYDIKNGENSMITLNNLSLIYIYESPCDAISCVPGKELQVLTPYIGFWDTNSDSILTLTANPIPESTPVTSSFTSKYKPFSFTFSNVSIKTHPIAF